MNNFVNSFGKQSLQGFKTKLKFFLLFGILSAEAQIVNIPDNSFKSALLSSLQKIDLNHNKEIEVSEARSVTFLNIGTQQITSLKGIEEFVNLDTLFCYGNKLDSLDLTNNVKLTYLDCGTNLFSDLDLTKNIALKYLNCSYSSNKFSMNLSNNKALETLVCSNNVFLSSLDVSQNIALKTLKCNNNQLKSLNISNNKLLETLDCSFNLLTKLDITQNTFLVTLNCNNNGISALNLSTTPNINLTRLNCNANYISNLDVSNNIALIDLDCRNNYISHLDLTQNPGLKLLSADYDIDTICIDISQIKDTSNWLVNPKTKLSTTCKPPIPTLYFSSPNFKKFLISNYDINRDGQIQVTEAEIVKKLNFNTDPSDSIYTLSGIEAFINLKELVCAYRQVSFLDLSKNSALESITLDNNLIKNINVSKNLALKVLSCSNNLISSLDLSQNISLVKLDCSFNPIKNLDVNANIFLKYLVSEGTNITTLDLSKNTFLESLSISDNKFKSLDLSNNKSLISVACYSNLLTFLDLSNNTALQYLGCWKNKINSINISNNPNLSQLDCENNQLTSLDLSKISKLLYVNCYANGSLKEICINNQQLNDTMVINKDANAKFNTKCGLQSVVIQIPDTNLKNILIKNGVDTNKDGEIEVNEAQTVTRLNISNSSISSLKGIEAFSSLTYLNCSNNQLDSIDVSPNTLLDSLDCSYNQLVFINVGTTSVVLQRFANERVETTMNATLVWLNASHNLLHTLDVTNDAALVTLITNANPNLAKICINTSQFADTASWNSTKDSFTKWSSTCANPLGLEDENFEQATPTLVRIYTSLGLEIKPEDLTNGIYIYQYSDGRTRKVMKLE